MSRLAILLLALGLVACSRSSAPPAGPTAAAEDDDSPVVGPPGVAWKDMTKKQRGRYMSKVVMPVMEPLFKDFDAKRYAEFGCDTCHGKGADAGTFEMPNPDLLAIPGPDDPEAFAPIFEKQPEMVKFMGGKVMPEMARLLGREPFDYQNPKPDAFGCLGCHTKKPKTPGAAGQD
jgi:hypothetical protein